MEDVKNQRNKNLGSGSPKPSLLVLALGNEILGNQGASMHALHALENRVAPIGDSLDMILTFKHINWAPLEFFFEAEGYDYLLILDADCGQNNMGNAAGPLDADELALKESLARGCHLKEVHTTLCIGQAHDYRLPTLWGAVLLNLGPKDVTFGTKLTHAAKTASAAAVELAIDMIRVKTAKDARANSPRDTTRMRIAR